MWRRSIVVVGLILVAGMLTGSAAPVPRFVTVLQMNLCDSGLAECYTGRSVAEASAVIRITRPDVVTLDEVCAADLPVLRTAMGGPGVASAFAAAPDRRTGQATRCRDGQAFGIGLIARVRGPWSTTTGVYATQDPGDPEERVWLCLDDAGRHACATHLANMNASVALAQCRFLLATMRAAGHPAILGGDLNLGDRAVRGCVPAGYPLAGDGGVQHVLATPGYTVRSRADIAMHGTTDHPGLLVAFEWPTG